jgi:CRISPR-associated protein Cas1
VSSTSIYRRETARRRLASPTLAMLPRVADSLSFLYLDAVRVAQDDTGVCARVGQSGGGDRVNLPTAALSCVLLGPGTSITQPALATLARHGTTEVTGTLRWFTSGTPNSENSRQASTTPKTTEEPTWRTWSPSPPQRSPSTYVAP